jgi:TonB family protein
LNQRFFILIIIFLLTIPCPIRIFAQTKSTIKQESIDSLKSTRSIRDKKDTIFFETPDSYPKDVFINPEEWPVFPGGEQALIEYVIKNTNYPESAIKDSVEGRVMIRFAVDIDGSTRDVSVTRGIRADLNSECTKVVLGMPKWKPGSTVFRAKKGLYRANMKVWYSIPFTFSLTNDNNKNGIIIKPRQTNDN